MAEETLSATLELKDQVSNPAAQMAEAIKNLASAADALNKKMDVIPKKIDKATSSMKNFTVGLAVTKKAFYFVEQAIGIMTHSLAGMLELTEDFDIASRTFEIRYAEKGNDTLKGMVGLLEQVGERTKDALNISARLAESYDHTEGAQRLANIVSLIHETDPVADVEKLTTGFVKMSAKIYVGKKEFIRFTTAMNRAPFAMKDLAAETGKTEGQVRAMLKAGTVKGIDFVGAMERAARAVAQISIETDTGQAALDMSKNNLKDQVIAVENAWDQIKLTIGKNIFENPEMVHMLGKLSDTFQRIASNPQVASVLKSIGEAIGGFGIETLKKFNNLLDEIPKHSAELKMLAASVGDVASGFVKMTSLAISGITLLAKGVIKLGEGLGFLIDKFVLMGTLKGASAISNEEWEKRNRGNGIIQPQTSNLAPVSLAAEEDVYAGFDSTQVPVQPGLAGAPTEVAPANAKGGTVMTPAAGEVFASVAPGEMILPPSYLKRDERQNSSPVTQQGDMNVTFENHIEVNKSNVTAEEIADFVLKVQRDSTHNLRRNLSLWQQQAGA